MINLNSMLEGLIFSAGDGITIEEIVEKLPFQCDRERIETALSELEPKYSGGSGIVLLRYGDKVQFATNELYGDYIAEALQKVKEKFLTNALLTTLAIIAYSQPVTRNEIEEQKGASADYALSVLSEGKLIEVVGRKDSLGKPLLYGTTDDFLKRFNLRNLGELPDYKALLNRLELIKTSSETREKSLLDFDKLKRIYEDDLPDIDDGGAEAEKSGQLNKILSGDARLEEYLSEEAAPDFVGENYEVIESVD